MSYQRSPGDMAEYEQLRAEAFDELARYEAKCKEMVAAGHDEACLVSTIYAVIFPQLHTREDAHNLTLAFAFAVAQKVAAPLTMGCDHG